MRAHTHFLFSTDDEIIFYFIFNYRFNYYISYKLKIDKKKRQVLTRKKIDADEIGSLFILIILSEILF